MSVFWHNKPMSSGTEDPPRPVEDPLQPVSGTASGVETETPKPRPREIGGPQGLEPTRYGDWEKNGRCIDF